MESPYYILKNVKVFHAHGSELLLASLHIVVRIEVRNMRDAHLDAVRVAVLQEPLQVFQNDVVRLAPKAHEGWSRRQSATAFRKGH
ncbi:MAG: hypothetical protein F082_334 [bacterium F082]|nr:MAG: hypothetical protein F082_334 [bacterium F082]